MARSPPQFKCFPEAAPTIVSLIDKTAIDQHGAFTAADAQTYREHGVVILRGAFSPAEVQALRDETLAICRGERGDFQGIDRVPGETPEETLARYLCIHFPHKLSRLMRETLAHPRIVEALAPVIGPNVKCMQSMLFIKAAGKPGQAWHQDEFYIPTRDRSLTGAWIALDDATEDNGCLWAIPGSHRRGILYPQRPATDRANHDCTAESYQFPYSDADAVPLAAAAGDVVVFNGYVLHKSMRNRAAGGYRRALVNHYMSAESFLPWMPQEGVHMAATDLRDVVLVAGEDPYAWKGTEDVMKPYLRPSGESGCGNAPKHSEDPDKDTPA